MLIVYFHGLGSCAANKKVDVLREAGFNVIAPEIPVDPIVAEEQLNSYLHGALQAAVEMGENNFVFVGTSLGGYWAARMGHMFEAKQVLINPSFRPHDTLHKYARDGYFNYATDSTEWLRMEDVFNYTPNDVRDSADIRSYFIALGDEVVTPVVPDHRSFTKTYDSNDHRGESFFDDVIEHLRSMDA